ncbi:MAG: hypothetical protein ABI690_33195 [Chloroflexota bacterium]
MNRVAPLLNLLNDLGVMETLNLAIYYLETYAPKFKQSHPEEKWVGKHLEMIKIAILSGAMVELRANPILVNNSDKVSETLASVIGGLRTAVLNMDDANKSIETVAEVISRTFMMEISERMEMVTPELSEKPSSSATTVQEAMNEKVMVSIRSRNNPLVVELENNLWLGLADEIQRRLELKDSNA